jgi:hypothetical protein
MRTLLTLVALFSFTLSFAQDGKSPAKKLRHVVLFKFKEDTSRRAITMIEKEFVALGKQLKEVKEFEWGLNNSPEGLDKGFTHGFLVTFASEKDRDTYLPHPKHQAFVAKLKPYLEDALVFDYWAF